MSNILGPDLSTHNGKVDAGTLAKHCQFAIFRAGYGGGGVDDQFKNSQAGARKHKLVHGSYFFAYPGRGSGTAQAKEYLKIVGALKPGEFLVLDVEDEPVHGSRLPSNIVQWSLDFLRYCESKTGVKPLVYMNLDVHNRFNWAPVIREDFGLWLAYWDHSPKGRVPSVKWPFVAIEQYTNRESIPGVNDPDIDMNIFHGDTIAQLKAYGKDGKATNQPKPSPTPSPTPAPKPKTNPVYTVRRGDTLGQIGSKFGVDWNKIVSANKKKYPDIGTGSNQFIAPGWKLTIPLNGQAAKPSTPKSIIITVPKGPSGYLGNLARQYGTTVSHIINLNKHKYPKIGTGPNAHIEAGWVIRVR